MANGRQLFDLNCVSCHGAPGVKRAAIANGLYPRPSTPATMARAYTPGELFWILKHGISLTGMPAFVDKMTTEQIWQLAGYVQTIGAYSAKTAAPSRNDEKQTRPAENRAPAALMFDEGPTPVRPDQGPEP